MKAILIACILVARMAAPGTIIIPATSTTADCTTATAGCLWYDINQIAKTTYKNIIVVINDEAGTYKTAITAAIARMTNITGVIAQVDATSISDASTSVTTIMTRYLTNYPTLKGFYIKSLNSAYLSDVYTYVITTKALAYCVFGETTNANSVTYPSATWTFVGTKANFVTATASGTYWDKTYVLIQDTKDNFVIAQTTLTSKSVKYVYGMSTVDFTVISTYMSDIAAYAKTTITCDTTCNGCVGSATTDCLACATNYTMNASTAICNKNVVSGGMTISAILSILVLTFIVLL